VRRVRVSSWSGIASLSGLFIVVTSVVAGLLVLITLLVGLGLVFIGLALLVVQSLPAFTEDLADLAEGDAGVLDAYILTLLIGEEHIGRETTLGRVGILLLLLDAARLGLASGGLLLRHDWGGLGGRFGWSLGGRGSRHVSDDDVSLMEVSKKWILCGVVCGM